MREPKYPPTPPIEMPPARTVRVPDRGEFFIRDGGGHGTPVMLLHGWMATADVNWWASYGALMDAGYRVLAIDHRGHGRGLRPLNRFTLSDCAADAAAVLRELDLAPAVVVGYSMGGAIAQLVGKEHPDVVEGLVLGGTAQHWQDAHTRLNFAAMGVLGLALSLAPRFFWSTGMKRVGIRRNERTVWLQSELMRHSGTDIAEAGRELGRFDSRPWLGSVQAPIATLITARDQVVSVRKQRELAAGAAGPVFEVPLDHLEVGWRMDEFNPVLLEAIEAVSAQPAAKAA